MFRSRTAREYPIVRMPLISGEISIAPMMTAVELTLRPMDAIRIASIRIHILEPWMMVFSFIIASMSS